VSDREGAAAHPPLQSIHESVWIAPSAQIYGKISVGEGSSVWHNAVARAECEEIRVGRFTNIQDFVMIHVGFGDPTTIGDFCSVAHHATVHGCALGDATLVGPGAVIMDGAVVGPGSIIAGGAVIPEGKTFGAGAILAGVPAKQIAERDSSRANRLNAWNYHRNAEFTARGDHRCWDGPDYRTWLTAKKNQINSDQDLL